jgi:hypothetical protein
VLTDGEGVGGELVLALRDRAEELLQIAIGEQLATLDRVVAEHC